MEDDQEDAGEMISATGYDFRLTTQQELQVDSGEVSALQLEDGIGSTGQRRRLPMPSLNHLNRVTP